MTEQGQQHSSSQVPDALTVDAATVAKRLSLSPATINNWAKASTMPAYRVGRSWILFQAEFDAWLVSTSTESNGSEPLPTLQQMTADLPPFLRLAEVAQVLCVSTATVTTLVTSRQLGSVDVRSVRRVPAEALRTYLAGARNTA
jgi:excisionase family DNA binding protein